MSHELTRILYVEDEPDIRVVGQLALQRVGHFEVSVCGSGREALDLVRSDRPDLILLDVVMPELDGPSTLESLRELPELADVPVIFMTARVSAADVRTYERLGAIGVISKPFDPMQLAAKVRGIWGEHRAKRGG
jgi:two-component system OmpR family response regulator